MVLYARAGELIEDLCFIESILAQAADLTGYMTKRSSLSESIGSFSSGLLLGSAMLSCSAADKLLLPSQLGLEDLGLLLLPSDLRPSDESLLLPSFTLGVMGAWLDEDTRL